MSEEVSAKIAKLGFVMAFLVIVIHSFPLGVKPMCVGSLEWWANAIVKDGACGMAVPMFFAFSGYLLGGHVNEKGWYGREVKKRFRTLLVPYLIWSALWLVFMVPIMFRCHMPFPRGFEALKWLGLYPFDRPALYPFWYVRALLVLVVCSGAIASLLRRFGGWVLLGTFIVALVLVALVQGKGAIFLDQIFPLRNGCGLFFFALGMYLRMKDFSLKMHKKWAALLLVVGLCMVWAKAVVMCFGESDLGARVLRNLSLPFLVVGAWGGCSSRRWSRQLTSCAFPVFCIHAFVIVCLNIVMPKTINAVALVVLKAAFASLISILMVLKFRQAFPKVSGYCFGGR